MNLNSEQDLRLWELIKGKFNKMGFFAKLTKAEQEYVLTGDWNEPR